MFPLYLLKEYQSEYQSLKIILIQYSYFLKILVAYFFMFTERVKHSQKWLKNNINSDIRDLFSLSPVT
jgi:hypothetical protein